MGKLGTSRKAGSVISIENRKIIGATSDYGVIY